MASGPAAPSCLALGSSHFFLFMIWLEIQFIPSCREVKYVSIASRAWHVLELSPTTAEPAGALLYLHSFPRQG